MKNKIKIVEIDILCKIGIIFSIILSGLILATIITFTVLFFLAVNSEQYVDIIFGFNMPKTEFYLMIPVVFIFLIGQIITLVLSILLLKGKLSSNIIIGVFSLIFSGFIGGLLILLGKYNVNYAETSTT